MCPRSRSPTAGAATRPSHGRWRGTTSRGSRREARTRSPRAGSGRVTARRTRCSRRSRVPGASTAGRRPPPRRRTSSLAAADDDKGVAAMLDKALRDGPDELPRRVSGAALRRWAAFRDRALRRRTTTARDRPRPAGTSRLSPYLKVGSVHPRTLLADLAGRRSRDAMTFETELAWREFYADVLLHQPGLRVARPASGARRADLRRPGDAFDAWREGRTGYPIVDAGMRQLLSDRLDAQPGADDHRQLPRRRTCTPGGRSAPGTSSTTCSTATSRRTTTAGSGRPAPVPTRRRTSACSTRSPREEVRPDR